MRELSSPAMQLCYYRASCAIYARIWLGGYRTHRLALVHDLRYATMECRREHLGDVEGDVERDVEEDVEGDVAGRGAFRVVSDRSARDLEWLWEHSGDFAYLPRAD